MKDLLLNHMAKTMPMATMKVTLLFTENDFFFACFA